MERYVGSKKKIKVITSPYITKCKDHEEEERNGKDDFKLNFGGMFFLIACEPLRLYGNINSAVRIFCELGFYVIFFIIIGTKIRKRYLSIEAMFKPSEEEKR